MNLLDRICSDNMIHYLHDVLVYFPEVIILFIAKKITFIAHESGQLLNAILRV